MTENIFNELVVVKRSGQRVNFNGSKIAVAIKCAFDSIYESYDENKINKVYENVLEYISLNYKDRKTINVEDIQDIIEQTLRDAKYLDIYKSFSDYRQKRAISRKAFTEKQQHKFVKAIEKIAQDKNLINEQYVSPSDIISKFGSIISGEYIKTYVLDNKYVRAHEEGIIYIHNLEYFNFGLFPKVHLKLTNRLNNSCLNNITIECLKAQREIADEIVIDAIDYLLSDWVLNNFKNLFFKYLKNYLKVNSLLELINLKKLEETVFKEENIRINVENYQSFILNYNLQTIFKEALDDSLKEINTLVYDLLEMFIDNLEQMALEHNRFTITTGLNKSDIGQLINNNLVLVLNNIKIRKKVSFIFKVRQNDNFDKIISLIQNKYDISIMYINEKNEHLEYFADGTIIKDLDETDNLTTGKLELSRTSINMARLGFRYQNKPVNKFYEELNDILELVKNELLLVFETIGDKSRENYQVLFRGNIYEDEKLEENQKIRKVIKNGVLNIGLAGLIECVQLLEPDNQKHYQLILNILSFINKKIKDYNKESKLNFRLVEVTDIKCRKELMAIDKTIYGATGCTNKNYYGLLTDLNSINHNFGYLVNIQKKFTGGMQLIIKLPEKAPFLKIKEILLKLQESKSSIVKIYLGK